MQVVVDSRRDKREVLEDLRLLGCDAKGKGSGAVDSHGTPGPWHVWPTHSAAVLEVAELV